jgi:hypothetical protein
MYKDICIKMPVRNDHEKNMCIRCKKTGHTAARCFEKMKETCKRCGQPGHWVSECQAVRLTK